MRPFTSTIDVDLSAREAFIREIQVLLSEKLSIRVESAEMDLLEAGVLDSVAQVQLLLHLEKHFGAPLPMEELEVDSFRSVAKMAELIADRVRRQPDRPVSTAGLASPEPPEHLGLIVQLQALLLDKLAVEVEMEQDLFATGVFDSMALVQFILVLEEHFGFHVPLEDLDVDSFRTVAKIAELAANRMWASGEPELNGSALVHAKSAL